MNWLSVSYRNHDFINFFFRICFMSVNEVVSFTITDDFEQLNMSMSYVDVDLFKTNYVDGLTDIFLDQ
jgi:hypothetical protein